ncbi:Glycerophosphoryl diester phosphodiesterase [Botrimarina colliarenosi]|uniref:Glycerophosphoryl diester phosphodiesterase n=1 Tax=Botrimarina colliarenosi TaxID=2528001 RepID=A0A5C6AHK6_9BACT|nr:glycerophosphodiester phosphodiesterase family protein [Botrimarina colliarenosi]TWT99532.1 Glycerophosphoryl diester phosphodiesterase [Botrimarina colliarenosi]
MPPLSSVWTTAGDAWNDCRHRWRSLLLTGVAVRVVSLLLLTPLYAVTLRIAIAGSGRTVLTDQDLLYFVTSPIGLGGLFLVSVAIVAAVALELAAFLVVLSQPSNATSLVAALRTTLARCPRVLRVSARLVIQVIIWIAPAGAVAAATYALLLSQFDINYYLTARPAAFWAAGAIAVCLGVYVAVVGLKLSADWFLALPIALFEGIESPRVPTVSRERMSGSRWEVRGWIIGWLAASLLVSMGVSLLVGATAWLLAPFWPRSLTAVAAGVGLGLAALVAVGVATNLLSTVAFAALLRRLYLRLGGSVDAEVDREALDHQRGVWLTATRLATGVGLALLAAVTIGFVAISSVPIEDDVLVIGHRGSPLSAPGNTLASVRAAIEDGADWVEIDVQETADGEVVVFHDSDFMKAAGVDLKIWDATANRLAAIDLGAGFAPEFAGERVPTFAEVLAECRGKAGVVVELKYYGHDVRLEQRVIEIVEREGMADQTMFMSLYRPGVEKFKSLRPDWRVGQLLSVAVGSKSRLEGDFLAINGSFAKRGLIRSAHRDGREVYAWTVDDPLAMSALISRGVDGVVTNLPAVARSVLAERSGMPPIMRLLVDLADRFKLASPYTPAPLAESP